MVSGYLIDTSVLRVFSSIERLDLMEAWSPLLITPEILREHGQAPPHAVKTLSVALTAGHIEIDVPDLADLARRLTAANPALSFVDAEAILQAEQEEYAIFVADDEFRKECTRREIPVAGVASILHSLRRQEKITAKELGSLASAMEHSGYYIFSAVERKGLGL